MTVVHPHDFGFFVGDSFADAAIVGGDFGYSPPHRAEAAQRARERRERREAIARALRAAKAVRRRNRHR